MGAHQIPPTVLKLKLKHKSEAILVQEQIQSPTQAPMQVPMDAPMPFRGGTKQLLARFCAEDSIGSDGDVKGCNSMLAERLLLLIGWDLRSPNCARWVAEGSVQDGCTHPQLISLTGLGTHGKHPANCRRDLFRQFCPTMQTPRPIKIDVPMLGKGDQIVWESSLLRSPLAHLQFLYKSARPRFQQFIGNGIEEFWSKLKPDDPKFIAIKDKLATTPN